MSTGCRGRDQGNPESGRILVMTVGTGDLERLEETLLTPLRKSIATDHWARVILLPSGVTEAFAQRLQKGLEGVEVVVRALPEGDENDADRAYAHFNAVLAEALVETSPDRVAVDFTRGTKAMGAALVLASARHEIPRLRSQGSELVTTSFAHPRYPFMSATIQDGSAPSGLTSGKSHPRQSPSSLPQ